MANNGTFFQVHTFSTAIRKVARLDILNILNMNIIAEVSLNISKSAKCQTPFSLEGWNSTFTLQIIKTVYHANFSTNPQWRRWFWGILWYFLKILEWQLWKCQVRTVWNILRHPFQLTPPTTLDAQNGYFDGRKIREFSKK